MRRIESMGFYSVHVRGALPEAAASAVVVRQAFDWEAFFLGPFWLIWHKLWRALALWSGIYLALLVGSSGLLSAGPAFLIALAVQALFGLEAGAVLEAKLASEGYRLIEIVAAPSRSQAETAFYREFEAAGASLAGARAEPAPGTAS
jgi:hypothetical protein